MSEILKVLNKKSVELKSEVVELGIVQDLEAKVKAMVPTYNELEKTSEERQDLGIEYSKLKDKEKKLVSTLEGDARVIEKDLDNAKKKAKDLGVTLDTKFIENNLKQLKGAIKANTAF